MLTVLTVIVIEKNVKYTLLVFFVCFLDGYWFQVFNGNLDRASFPKSVAEIAKSC